MLEGAAAALMDKQEGAMAGVWILLLLLRRGGSNRQNVA
jgi:hypothetical protein